MFIVLVIYVSYVYIKYNKPRKSYDHIDKHDSWWNVFIDWESNNADSTDDSSSNTDNSPPTSLFGSDDFEE